MVTKIFGRVFPVLAFVGLVPLAAFAEEVVHFTNGAEMTVRSHSLENNKALVKLDLGGNSFISFPMSMVDKIVSAGKDVFLNPGFHPSNQAVAGGSVSRSDTTVQGIGDSGGLVPRPDGKGHAGIMLGEAADALPSGSAGGQQPDQTVMSTRRRFNPVFQQPPGGPPQTIAPAGAPVRGPVQLALVGGPRSAEQQIPTPPPPVNDPTPDDPPAEDPAPEDPPDTP